MPLRPASSSVTVVCPGLTRTELTHSGGTDRYQDAIRDALDGVGLDATAIADAIGYAVDQPDDVDVNEVVVRSTASLQG
ncbi:hypothetical protein [Kitasatospora brasiliensis]|uniref:hypothetical protein n=1 Tax=Kitasatospora brasiliensis TaxID=3058040 RepID=UPI00292D6B7D|nr:hypothetical protein [Kitasatospora sp. K002]